MDIRTHQKYHFSHICKMGRQKLLQYEINKIALIYQRKNLFEKYTLM